MGPLKHRPKVVLLAPSEIRVGEEIRATVRVHVRRRVRIRALTVEWAGQEEARFGSGEYTARTKYRSPGGPLEILGACTLEAGEQEHPVRLIVPPNMSPSYSGRRCATRHSLEVRLHIPWWFDRHSAFEVPVELAQGMLRYPGEPMVFASREGGPEAKKPYVEGSLASDVVAPGDVVRGAIALLNTEHNRYAKVTVAMVGTEVLQDGRRRERREAYRLSTDIETSRPQEGESFPLALRLPDNLAASARASLWSLQWSFEVLAKVRLGRDEALSAPITVAPAHVRPATPLQLMAPRVGSARQHALWESVAKTHGLEFFGAKMRAAIGSVSLDIARHHRGRRGWSLVATLRYEPLRIDARIEHASILKGTAFGFSGMNVGQGAWARNHVVRARSETQSLAFFQALAPELGHFPTVKMDDEQLELERADSGIRRRRLNDFVMTACQVAERLSAARAELPQPPEFAEATESWTEFAASLGSALEPGDMSIEGSYQGLTVRTGHRWIDGTLSASVLGIVGLIRQDEDDCLELEASGDDGLLESDLEGLEESARELLKPALLGARSFSSGRDEDWIELSPALDPELVKTRLGALARYSSLRAAVAGPYR